MFHEIRAELSIFQWRPTVQREVMIKHIRSNTLVSLTWSSYHWFLLYQTIWGKNLPTPLWRWRRAYWGAISYTKCSMTFVNIAVAISALAGGGGPKNDFAPRRNFGTESKYWWCFRSFVDVFVDVWTWERIEVAC